MKRRVLYIVGGVAVIILIVGICLLYNYIKGITVQEVDSIIKSHIPIGSNKSEVNTFVDSLKIDSLQVENFGYQDDLTDMRYGTFDDKDKQLKGTVKGYLDARIFNTSRTLYLSQCWMDVRFYFDRDERLIDYEIHELFDGP